MAEAASYEKLGAFYLGREVDGPDGDPTGPDVLYDSKDLTTHAVIVGMTGSGKTGLAVGMLEEAGIDGVPSIAIDVKGDLTNLLLTFPDLAPDDFRPWIDPGAAARKGKTPEQMAASTAELWRGGLESWGQDGERIRRFREAVDLKLFTPGSTSGTPISLLGRLDAPPPEVIDDAEAMRDLVMGTVSGLLTLLGIDADPVKSREHIFLSNVLDRAWREGRSLDLPDLIRAVQSPPFDTVGVIALDTFFPPDDRMDLAMLINNLLASPSFNTWRQGEPLDIERLLYDPSGKPRSSILYIAHLGDAERMFFVTRLLNDVVAWMRTKQGTSSLRALLYMDEVFGYFPPTANPPSKRPLLTLMKQARAFGVGVVLATQNPVDLDYKGLSNAGTWMLGRLQTERDKQRVLDGLEGVDGGGLDRSEADRILSALGKRRFLLHNVHEDGPLLFQTRWVLSYLAGPLTLTQVKRLAPPKAPETPTTASTRRVAPAEAPAATEEPATLIPADIPQVFVPASRYLPADAELVYRPALIGEARLHYVRASWQVDEWAETTLLAHPEGGEPWADGKSLRLGKHGIADEAEREGAFENPPADLLKKASYKSWGRGLKDWLYRDRVVTLYRSKALKMASSPGETEGAFRVRIQHAAREARDVALEALREKYDKKLETVEKRLRTAQERLDREESQYEEQRMRAVLDVGTTLLGALVGRRRSRSTVSGASRAAKGFGRAARERDDIARAREKAEALHGDIRELESELQREVQALHEAYDPENLELETLELAPRKSDIQIKRTALAWTPWVREDGLVPAYETID